LMPVQVYQKLTLQQSAEEHVSCELHEKPYRSYRTRGSFMVPDF
jgi:hypothetical protein